MLNLKFHNIHKVIVRGGLRLSEGQVDLFFKWYHRTESFLACRAALCGTALMFSQF